MKIWLRLPAYAERVERELSRRHATSRDLTIELVGLNSVFLFSYSYSLAERD